MRTIIMTAILAVLVSSSAALADACDAAIDAADKLIAQSKVDSSARFDELEERLETHGMRGHAERACFVARMNLADFDRVTEAHVAVEAACPADRGFTCDSDCLAWHRTTLVATMTEACDPKTHE